MRDLREFLAALERTGQLVRVAREVDPDQDVTIIQHRVQASGGPAMLFEKVKGSPYRLATNLFGTPRRVELALGAAAAELGGRLARLAQDLAPPTAGALWRARGELARLLRSRLRLRPRGPVLQTIQQPPRLDLLPCLTCWPHDGGAFFTLPLVHTADPVSGRGNLGIYRMQRYDDCSTGMHWQIEKGGGFHFSAARKLREPLPVSVLLGGPPALTLAAVAPMPEGFDERLLAAWLMGRPLDVVALQNGHRVPANCEFVLEGAVAPGDERVEGPLGDHLGHYSRSGAFPVFRVTRMLARRDAIFPATVVGIPPQEDYHIGCALQELMLPLIRLALPGVRNLWAYPQTGFHPLAVAAVRDTYPHEALRHALAVLGQGQLSLTKVLVAVGQDVDVRNFQAVSDAIWRHWQSDTGLHLLAPTAQDTLDFTGPAMNTGSRLVLLATGAPDAPPARPQPPPAPPGPEVHPAIERLRAFGRGVLLARLASDDPDHPRLAVSMEVRQAVRAAMAAHPAASAYVLHVLVSPDVPIDDDCLALWGWFTRFDPLSDVMPAGRTQAGNRLLLTPPICIDATWKKGYRLPVAFDPERQRRVMGAWGEYGLP